MYFINNKHKENFKLLIENNIHRNNDKQYLVNFYVAAVPDIFELININATEIIQNPLYSLMQWDDKSNKHIPSSPGLTGTTTMLLEIGLSLFNGHKCDLDYSFEEEFSQVILQACKIRYGLTVVPSTSEEM